MKELVPSRGRTLITESVRLRRGVYRLSGAEEGALILSGDDILLDFDGAELIGSPEGATPETFAGVGVVSKGNSRITIRNARIRGFKVAIYVQGGKEIRVENCDLSDNYAARLQSTPEREDPSDWLWPHHNDANEWMTHYGASLYVEECADVVICRNRSRHTQNGILLDHVDDSHIYDNDCSFLSGWGLGMWRSCRNVVARNRFDWCVRGYSHGVYWRGQDSAGILVFEQCSDNLFALNSATHGGDGFFLYAGNETLRVTGEGGCNRNVLYRNDFSHAVANGIEATFSDANAFIENRLDGCQHGIWGGYSYRTRIVGNRIRYCAGIGIAIEHGHENLIEGNDFVGNPTGVFLWWDPNPDLTESAYGRKHNTKSERNCLVGNRFQGDRVAVALRDTQDTWLVGNCFVSCGESIRQEGNCEGTRIGEGSFSRHTYEPPPLPGEQDAFLPEGHPRGRAYIVIGEWGPREPIP